MSNIAAQRPHFSLPEVTDLAKKLYGITAIARPLPSERDQNFHLTVESGEAYWIFSTQRWIISGPNLVTAFGHVHAGHEIWRPLPASMVLTIPDIWYVC